MFGFKSFLLLACIAMPVLSAAPVSTNTYSCLIDWLGYHGHCYRHYNYDYTWTSARDFCRGRGIGADLASIHSAEENMIINALAGGEQVWLGFSDIDEEGTYKWTDGTPFDFNNWNSGQPDNAGTAEDCGEMNYGPFPKSTWNDGQCQWEHGFICKI